MKRWIPWILVAVFAAWVLAALPHGPETGFHVREFGKLPVLLNGRIQPFDSVARNALRQIRARQTVALGAGRSLTATEWLLEVMMKPDAADDRKIFRVDNLELLDMIRLPRDRKYCSFNEIRPHSGDIRQQAQSFDKIDAASRTAFQRQLLKLYHGLVIYRRLQLSLCPPGTDDFTAELAAYQQSIPAGVAAVRAHEAGQRYDEAALNRLVNFMSGYSELAESAYLLVVPPAPNAKSRDDWQNLGASLMNLARGGNLEPAVKDYATMVTAYRQNRPDDFNRALGDYRWWLGEWFAPETNQGAREFFYNSFQPFYQAIVIYVAAFLLAVVALLTFVLTPKLSETLRRSAFGLVALGSVIHTFGLGFRMVLEGRPPVTNLYSSAVFVGWSCVILGMVLERVFAVGLGSAVASFTGFVTLVIAHNLALGGDTMEMLPAVLDTNFWLAVHVITVTLGYAATFVAGLLGITYVLLGLFTPVLKYATGKMELGRALVKMVYGLVCFATLFSFIGTVAGGFWADVAWGRFWGWDVKENGALLIVLWNAIILHARWGGLVRERGLMNLAIFGNVVTSFSWFGVNMLGIGLHSYGFMDAAFKWLMLFDASQMGLILLGLLPPDRWKSSQAP
jgi:ABC-type transport system involved in cytochrome c biogenesis permease subunit